MKALAIALVLVMAPLAAHGGGSWMQTTKPSYQPGDTATAIGFVSVSQTQIDGGPWLAILATEDGGTLDLGPVQIQPTGLGGYLSVRVSITFEVPDLPDGYYGATVTLAHDDTAFLGGLIGFGIAVGVEQDLARTIEWPLDEPALADLEDDAVVVGPMFSVGVAQLRAGHYPDGAEAFMYDPSVLPDHHPRSPFLRRTPRSDLDIAIV